MTKNEIEMLEDLEARLESLINNNLNLISERSKLMTSADSANKHIAGLEKDNAKLSALIEEQDELITDVSRICSAHEEDIVNLGNALINTALNANK